EPAAEPQGGKGGGLAGLLASIIPRSTPQRTTEPSEPVAGEAQLADAPLPDEPLEPGPPLPEPVPAVGPLLVAKGKARAAPPTDLGAINHQMNPLQGPPEGAAAAGGFDPLAGQPEF